MPPKRSSPRPDRARHPRHPTPKPPISKPKSSLGPISSEEINLVRTPGTPGKGGGPSGEAWRIMAAGERAGDVSINVIDEPPLGRHASIQIHLNQKSRGRRIGRVGYRAACEASQHDTIYAHMRKSNLASRRAAEAAGFVDATPPGHTQLIMRRSRTS